MRHTRGPIGPSINRNRYRSAPDADGRGASTVTRKTPVGKDPLAVEQGRADTQAQMEFLAAKRRG